MTRVKRGNVARQRRKKVLESAKGFVGSLSKLYRPSKQAVTHALKYAYFGRKQKKRTYRYMWIARINAALKAHNMSYNRFIQALGQAKVALNRKMMAYIAVEDPEAFAKLVSQVQSK